MTDEGPKPEEPAPEPAPPPPDDAAEAADEPAPVAPNGTGKIIAIALCVVATGALLVASFAHHWLANPAAGRFSGGLVSLVRCDVTTDRCETTSNSDVIEELRKELPTDDRWVGERPDPPSSWFPRLGIITLVLGLLAALALVGSAGIALANK